MKRGKAERAVEDSNLPMADALILMMLLRRAHNDTLEVPDWRTPTLVQLATATRMSVWTLQRRLGHLEQHGWVKYVPGRGRGRKSTYSLLPDGTVPPACDCPHKRKAPMTDAERARRYRQKKGCNSRDAEAVKGATQADPFTDLKGCNSRVEKGATSRTKPQVTPVLSPRAHQGGRVVKEVLPETKPQPAAGRPPVDWTLINQLVRLVHDDPCGGIHRDELAEKCGVPPEGKLIGQALAIAYRRGRIDFCGRYVVKPIPKEKWPA